MNNISLKSKIVLLALILIGAMALVALVGILQLRVMNNQLNTLVEVNSEALRLVGDARSDVASVIREERQAILSATVDAAKVNAVSATEAKSKLNITMTALKEKLDQFNDDSAIRHLDSLQEKLKKLIVTSDQVIALAIQKSTMRGSAMLFTEYYPITVSLADPLRELGTRVPASYDARAKMFRVGFMCADHLQTSVDGDMKALDTQLDAETQKLVEYSRLVQEEMNEQERVKYPNLVSDLQKLAPLSRDVRELSRANTDHRATEMSRSQTTAGFDEVSGAFDELGRRLGVLLVDQQKEAATRFNAGTLLIVAVGFMGTLLAGVLTLLLGRSMNSAVTKGVSTLNELGQGNLTARMGLDRRDEIGQLSKATDAMTESLAATVQEIRALAGSLSSSSGQLSTVSHDLLSQSHEMSTQALAVASSTEQLSANINTMAAAAEEMSVNVSGISSASEEVSVNVGTISGSADQMSRSVAAVAQSVRAISQSLMTVARDAREESLMTDRATKMASDASATIQKLEHAAREINKVSEVIKMIALQTNLLALNATIEATSAGEAGKGFAVVAGEIKELALQSGQSAEDIARRIEGVQASTQQAVKAIEGITRLVSDINTSAGRISGAVEAQTKDAEQIEAAIAQTRTGIDSVARSIAEVAKGTTDMSSSTAEVSRAATDVSRNVTEAAKASHLIASNIHGVSDATRQNTSSSTQVNEAARKLSEIARNLEASVSRFKTGK